MHNVIRVKIQHYLHLSEWVFRVLARVGFAGGSGESGTPQGGGQLGEAEARKTNIWRYFLSPLIGLDQVHTLRPWCEGTLKPQTL